MTKEVAALSGISEGDVLLQLGELNDRVRRLLGYDNNPITATSAGGWKADGVAGLMRLNSRIELEVVPKFLDPLNSAWRADFFLLAVLVKTGHLLLYDDISAGTQDRGDLATLIARSLLKACAENERRPIRGYRRARAADFAIDGDVDWETISLPDVDGFAVTRLELTRKNSFNAILAAAIQTLISEVSDADTQAQLRRLRWQFGEQDRPSAVFEPLAPRHQSWRHPYDLAKLIVEGLGLNLDDGSFTGPGFVLSTWSAWEFLCEEILRRALPDHDVLGQKQWILGNRGSKPVYIKPDISPVSEGAVRFLLDAKYKTRLERSLRISSTDLYESLAFLHATKAKTMLLLYPALSSPAELPLGEWRSFDAVRVESSTIEGFEVQLQGLAERGGFDSLIAGARSALASQLNIPRIPHDAIGERSEVTSIEHPTSECRDLPTVDTTTED